MDGLLLSVFCQLNLNKMAALIGGRFFSITYRRLVYWK